MNSTAQVDFLSSTRQGDVIVEASDRIFDAAFAAACRVQPAEVVGKSYAGEFAFAEALRLSSDILAGFLSSCPERQRGARRRLEQLLTSGKDIS